MQFTLLFLAPLASLLQLGTALPAEPSAPALKVQKIAIPLNETRYWAELQSGDKEGLAKRDSCSSATPYSDSDMDALINSLYNDGETDYLPATGSLGYYIGTAIVSLSNSYPVIKHTRYGLLTRSLGVRLQHLYLREYTCQPLGNGLGCRLHQGPVLPKRERQPPMVSETTLPMMAWIVAKLLTLK